MDGPNPSNFGQNVLVCMLGAPDFKEFASSDAFLVFSCTRVVVLRAPYLQGVMRKQPQNRLFTAQNC
jgi:hypothetical protein